MSTPNNPPSPHLPKAFEDEPLAAAQYRPHESYPGDDLGFLQRRHPLRGKPWGQLIYMADSVMQPMQRPGFGMHSHRDVEVISYVAEGMLTHRDSAGNVGVVPAGHFQRITAGSGIQHDETNRTDQPLRMFQIWFAPAVLGVTPAYDMVDGHALLKPGQWAQVIGPDQVTGALSLNANAQLSLARLAAGEAIALHLLRGRAGLLYVVDGEAVVGTQPLRRQDQLRLQGAQQHTVIAQAPSLLMWIDSLA